MRPPRRTTSSIGNNHQGFTFIEIMVALVILSTGIVMVYKSFFLCVDYLSYLTCRLYAAQMLDSKMADISRSFGQSKDVFFERGAMTETVEVNHKWVDFNYTIYTMPLSGLNDVYQLKVTLAWYDGRHLMKLSRTSLLTKI